MDAKDLRIAELESEVAAQKLEIAALKREIADLKALVSSLTEQLNRNSRNSHLPPSSDGPGARPPSKPKSGGKRGAKYGHRGVKRELVPPDKVSTFVEIFPPQCENCWVDLPEVPDPNADRYQVTEIPPIMPHITEYRRHRVKCTCCGFVTSGKVEGVVPASPFGPRLIGIAALLVGVFHNSRRNTVMFMNDVFGVDISLGGLSNIEHRASTATASPYDEAWKKADAAAVKHADATSWLQSGKLRSERRVRHSCKAFPSSMASSMVRILSLIANSGFT